MKSLWRTPANLALQYRSLFVLAVVLGTGLGLFAASPRAKALHTNGFVDTYVQWQNPSDGSAKPTVVGWENNCTSEFNANRASMPTSTQAEQRQVVNASAYNTSIWVTRQGDARDTNTAPVTAGTPVNMQINQMLFLCAIVVKGPSGFRIDPNLQVSNTRYINDRYAVPDDSSGDVNQASKYESNSKIRSVTLANPALGTITNAPVNQVLGYKRDSTSRYWRANPLLFTFTPSASLAPGTYNVVIRAVYSRIDTYHDFGNNSGALSRCDGHNVAYGDFNACGNDTSGYVFTLTIASPSNYNLTPDVGGTVLDPSGATVPGNVAEVGDSIRFTYAVRNTGTTASGSVNCNIYANTHPGAFTVPVPPESSGTPGPATGCPRTFAAGANVTLVTETIPVTADNQTICRSLWVNPATTAGGSRGDEACILVAAKPYLKVFGGDVSVGNGIQNGAACSANANGSVITWNRGSTAGYAGAETQYAALALNTITDFATAQGSSGAPTPSGLAFSNQSPSGNVFGGGFGALPCIPNYYDNAAAATPVSNTVNISSLGSGAYTTSGPTTIANGTIANPGDRIQLYVDGDVYIADNIRYPGSWAGADKVPLLELVVKGDIYVDNSVTQLDGLYIAQPHNITTPADGTIYTCANGLGAPAVPTDPTFYSTCNQKLTINGAFVANQVQFLRTFGSLAQSATSEASAEVFNFTPALWIAQPPAATGPSAKYDAITSLPPIL